MREATARVTTLLVLAAACSGETTPPTLPVIRGHVHAAGGGSVSGLRASWRGDGAQDTDVATVGADGAFAIQLSTADAGGELLIDGDPPRGFHPFLFPFDVDELADVDVVLVPRAWTIQSGIYAGQTVETHLDPVMDDDASRMRYSYFFGQPEPFADPTRYLVELMSWPASRFPAQVAFDHRHGAAAFTAQDSADIWGVLDQMEAVFGLNLFEPIEADPGWWPDEVDPYDPVVIPGVIRLVFLPPSWGALPLGDEDPLVWEQDLGTWASDGRFTTFQLDHQLLSGGSLLVGALEPLRLADGLIPWQTVLMHEMLHVLGVGHTCRIPSPQGPCLRTAEPSPRDVAYMELLRETMRLEREYGTLLGILPATIGERRVLLQLPALPALTAR